MGKPTSLYRDFLCACIGGDRTEVQSSIRMRDWNWEELFRTACDEALLPLLHSRFASLDLLDDLPKEVGGFLLAVESANRERNQAIIAELNAAVAILNVIGIQPVLLKGLAYLTTGVYSDCGQRFLMDIDLLIPEEQRKAAADALTQEGWLADDLDPFRHFRHHGPPLRRPSSVWIEIHHSLGTGTCERVLPARQVIARSLAVNLNGLRVRVPAQEDLLAHLILHSQMQHSAFQRIWPPIRAMADLLLLARRFGPGLHWAPVANRFSTAGQYGIFGLHLLQVSQSLGLTLPLRIRFNPALRFLWFRRRVLRRRPALRYFDPSYMLSIALARRLVTLRKVLATKEGARYLLSQVLAPGNYMQLWTDLVQGRGR